MVSVSYNYHTIYISSLNARPVRDHMRFKMHPCSLLLWNNASHAPDDYAVGLRFRKDSIVAGMAPVRVRADGVALFIGTPGHVREVSSLARVLPRLAE